MKTRMIQQTTTEDIQKRFREQYPYLKLEFYKHSHKKGDASPLGDRLNRPPVVKGVTGFTGGQPVSYGRGKTVAGFETEFFQKTGIAVQVMRRSGRVWIQTTETDDWTLEQQNKKGYEDSKPVVPDEPEDFGLQEND